MKQSNKRIRLSGRQAGYTMRMNPLTVIPGVGKSIAADLNSIGIFHVEELTGKDPQKLYDALRQKQGMNLDRCVLYVMRCAVYFASHKTHDPELLNWWKWKNRIICS